MAETIAEILYGITEEKYYELTCVMAKHLEGKQLRAASRPCIEYIEADDRTLREKIIMAIMLGQLSVIKWT